MKYLILVLATALGVMPCHARLGEALEQCVTRYGEAIPWENSPDTNAVADKFVMFSKSHFSITVIFIKGAVAYEAFRKAGEELSDDEQNALLKADSGSFTWIKAQQPNSSAEVWMRSDGAIAMYDRIDQTMSFESKAYRAAIEAKKSAIDKANLKDF